MIYGLGRLEAADDRDINFPMAAVLPVEAGKPRVFRYWNEGKIKLNQGSVPACVGYAWSHWIINGPVTALREFRPDPIGVYKAAQKIDEWPGENYAGTSVRAGAKVLQSLGFIESYLWTWKVEELIEAVLNVAPVVVGTNWYRGMTRPDKNGLIKPEGRWDGGHAYLINGANVKRELFRIQNSWGNEWGDTSNAWISFQHMERLIREGGEVCLAIEKKQTL